MDISISKTGTGIRARISGALTESDGESVKKAFEELLASGANTVTLDLSQAPIITSTGIGKIIVLHKRLKQQGRQLVLSPIHENLYTMFTSINLDKMLTIEKQTSETHR